MDMDKTKRIEVDGTIYQTTMYPGRYGSKIFAKYLKKILKPMAFMALSSGDGKGKEQSKEQQIELLKDCLGDLNDAIHPERFDQDVLEILNGTVIFDESGKNRPITPASYDLDFQGKQGHLMRLCKEILAFQFSDVFGQGALGIPDLMAPITQKTGIKAK